MQCPGQDSRYWDNEAIFEAKCSKCGNTVEFFKDDNKRKCGQCGTEMLNPKIDFGCASYCQYAEQCLGTLPPEMIAQKQELLIDRVAIEVKKMLGQDFEKISMMTKLSRFSEKMVKSEEQANRAVVLISSYFLPFVLGVTEEKEKQATLSMASDKLATLGVSPGIIDEISLILSSPTEVVSGNINHSIVNDSLVLMQIATKAHENTSGIVTQNGKEQAEQLLAG